AFYQHHTFHGFKHVVVPIFGLLANVVCMLFYLVGPFLVSGMSMLEPYIALGVAFVWGLWGAIYFLFASKAKGRSTLVTEPPAAARAPPLFPWFFPPPPERGPPG